jgi:DNA-binding NarL/FixJ family response regulator
MEMTAGKTKILIVDDHAIVAEGIKAALKKEEDFDIVGAAADGFEAIEMVKSLKPDIVILDISMPNLDGLKTTQEIRRRHDKAKIVIFSMRSDMELIGFLFKSGISGYVLKGRPLSELVLALRGVREGGTFYSDAIRRNLQDYVKRLAGEGDILEKLSDREKELFILLADGLTIEEIADRLFISPKTVMTHKYNIMEKLDVQSIAQLTKIAAKKGLIEI